MIGPRMADTGCRTREGIPTVTARLSILTAVAALVTAACGGGSTAPSTDAPPATSAAAPSSSTTAAGPAIDASLLTYAYAEMDAVEYAITVDQTMIMHADGDASAFDTAGELPLDAEIHATVDNTVRYETSPGTDPGTTRIHIAADLSSATVEGTINGEPVDETATDELGVGEIPPVDVTVVVDERGNVVDVAGAGLGDVSGLLGGGLGDVESLGTEQLARPVGPAFPDHPVGVGDSWTETTEQEGPDGPIVTTATHTVVGTDTVAGHDVLVIESVYETEGFDIDFTEFLRGLFEGFAGMGDDGDGSAATLPPETQEMLDQLEFVMSMDPSTSTVTSWFDPDEGLVVAADAQVASALSMRFRGPDESTGELVSFQADIELDQAVSYELVQPGA